jgi:lipopolysaccharide/colanic/teichoic acid biosynthesis glycosyltransferase
VGRRLFDIAFSAIALLLFLPWGMIIAAILRLTGEGEVLYRQERVGLHGKLFRVLKFATMVKDSEQMASGLLTVRDDPRVLPFGRFLRRTKLNEVPQLWNVLVGEMSVIGPRPQAPPHFVLYSEVVRMELTKVRPGLSGMGSIVFRDEESLLNSGGVADREVYETEIASYKGELELWYVTHRSVGIDLALILLTVWSIFRPKSRLYRRIFLDLPRTSLTALL